MGHPGQSDKDLLVGVYLRFRREFFRLIPKILEEGEILVAWVSWVGLDVVASVDGCYCC